MKIEYKNAAGKALPARRGAGSRDIDGHPTVVTSRVSDLLGGGKTDMQFRYIAYDIGIPGRRSSPSARCAVRRASGCSARAIERHYENTGFFGYCSYRGAVGPG